MSSVRGSFGVGSSGPTGSTTTVPQLGARVSAAVADAGTTPQLTWPRTTSPIAVGPKRYMWTALTVSDPSGFTICWLNTTVKTSPTLVMTPLCFSFTAGWSGMAKVALGNG